MFRLFAMLILVLAVVRPGAAGAADIDRASLGPLREATQDGITLRTAVPDAEGVEAIFGFPVIEKGIQPVFVEIENTGDSPLWYMPITTDPTYFAPLEVAWRFRDPLDPKSGTDAAATMTRLAMPLAVGAHSTASGFVSVRWSGPASPTPPPRSWPSGTGS